MKTRSLLTVLLVPFGTASSARIPAQEAPQRPFEETGERGNCRIFFWGTNRSGGQVRVEYGRPVWKDSYDGFVDDVRDRRWRLGQNFWTSLDTNMPLKVGGLELEPGLYYLALEHQRDGRFVLLFLDPQEMRDLKLDAFQVDETDSGSEAPLAYQKSPIQSGRLTLFLKTEPLKPCTAVLQIHFGNHLLSTSMEMHPDP